MRKFVLIAISLFFLAGSPALAKDAGSTWIVSQLSGDARVVHPGLQPVALTTAARLGPGDRIVTGLSGRATLTHGADYIIVAPRSDLQLPTAPQPQGFTRVVQNLGTMLFKVKHTGIPHFSVDTPMLAAVVKGTTFTVVVDKDRSAVQVIEGKVEVTAADGGMSRLVEGGKTVFIDRNEPKRLIDADQRSPATQTTSATAVKVGGSGTPTVAAIANLTDGLVRPGSQTSAPPSTAPTSATPVVGVASSTVVQTGAPVVSIVADTAPPVAGAVAEVVDTTVSGVTDTVTDVGGTVTDVVDTTVSGATGTVVDVVGTVTDVVDTTVSGTSGTVNDVVGTVTDVVDTTVSGTTGTVVDVVDTVTDVVDTTVSGVTDTVSDIVNVADNSGPGSGSSGPGGPVSDIVDTVVDVVDTVADTAGTTVNNVTTTTTDVLGSLLHGLFPH